MLGLRVDMLHLDKITYSFIAPVSMPLMILSWKKMKMIKTGIMLIKTPAAIKP